MKFSEVYSIDRTAADVWFDPILTHDTKLFLDPLLIAKQAISPFEGSHQKLVGFFDHAFVEAAKTDQDETKPRFRRLLAALEFPEVKELCLGYADKTTFGLGSAAGVAKVFAAGIYESIKAGITHIEHFEEVALFNEGIGADRISDVTGNILRRELAEYTLAICRTHNIPVEKFTIGHGEYDLGTSRWVPLEVQLPVNPFPKKRQPVLLVPEVYLNKLPEINYLDFADYMWRTRNELVRDELGIEIKEQLDKKKIVKLARAHREEADRYTAIKAEGPPRPYDLRQDPNRLYRWYGGAQQFVLANPMALPPATTRDQCLGVVDLIIQRYKQFVEQKGGYILLWNQNGKRKAEADAQRLFYAIAISYCQANNIDVTPEAETGRGPVDFKFSSGFIHRVIIEVKLMSNSHLAHGITVQTPTYMEAEETSDARILAVAHTNDELKTANQRLTDLVGQVKKQHGHDIPCTIVSAVKPPPASKAKK